MSNENLQQASCPMTQNDYVKLLDTLFQSDQSPKTIDKAFKYFESNFKSQPLIIYTLIDYYFDHGCRQKNEQSPDYSSYAENELFYTENSKTVIDLLLCVPDELSNKIFDKLNDKLNTIQSGSSTNLTSSSTNNFKCLEKTLYLLILISYKKKSWINKLLSHNLLNLIIKLIIRTNTCLNELVAVQTSLLFVSLMNSTPLQIYQQQLENFFNIFACLFKYLTNLENQNINDGMSYRSVKWSVRLYFYVCYGLFSNQFLQFLRKKDQFSINKDFISSIIFYLRLHPVLFREKNDLEKQLKQLNDDISLEWRQYCLDPLCTNYNNCVQKLLKSSSSNLQCNLYNFFMLNDQNLPVGAYDSVLTAPLSPSYIISSNRKSYVEVESSSKRNSTYSAQSSVPNTPTPLVNTTFNFPQIQGFSFDANQLEKKVQSNYEHNLTKNLTSHFMNDNFDSTQTLNFDLKQNFNLARNVTCVKKKSYSEPNLNIDFEKSDCYLRHKQVKSEMKDKNINEPCEFGVFFRNRVYAAPQTTDSSTNTCDDDSFFSSQTNTKNRSSIESNDIVSAYLMGLNQTQTETTTNQSLTISKLKQEINHLVIQLIYERNLRNRYEEDSNRLHFIKTERDQLIVEKKYLEKNLKQLVDKYKNEVEECLNFQNSSEIKSYKNELEEKNKFIETLQNKLAESDTKLKESVKECEELKKNLKSKTLDYDKLVQKVENEANLKVKNEIDQNYLKSLRYTTDLLRKKLLIMTKSQQKLVELFNQDLYENYNSQLVSAMLNKELNFQFDGQISKDQMSTLMTPLYQFQQKTIELLQHELESQKQEYNNLLSEFNDHELKLEEYKNKLKLKSTEVEELKQTLQMESVEMMAELLKSHHRIQTSLMNVNKRLEEEIAKLKSNLNEETIKNQSLKKQIDCMQANLNELKQLKLESLFQYEIVNRLEHEDEKN